MIRASAWKHGSKITSLPMDDIIRRTKNFHPWKPGEKYHYSNVGFGLLGYLVERLSGDAFQRISRKSIFSIRWG